MGPLTGTRVLELEAIGPVPFCAMVLGDLGADVIRIDRPGGSGDPLRTLMGRNRRSIAVDLKHPEGPEVVMRLVERADVLVEGMRPGVAERLGVGPTVCLERNPRLVYGRMTGWGREGPYAHQAGHDLDYIAVAGALHAIGDPGLPPPPPLNLVADFGGGAMFLALGVLAALIERVGSGRGQVVDAAMVDGVSALLTMFHEMRARGMWYDERGANLLDGGAPFYATYRTADDRYVAVAALEPKFYAELVAGLGLVDEDLPGQHDRESWGRMRRVFAGRFAERALDDWMVVFAGGDACVFPVVAMSEAPEQPHLAVRRVFVDVDGVLQPAPAPRFSRSAPAAPTSAPLPGRDTEELLREMGYDDNEIRDLRRRRVI